MHHRGEQSRSVRRGRLDVLEEVGKSRIGARDLMWRIAEALYRGEVLEAYSEVCDMHGLGRGRLRSSKTEAPACAEIFGDKINSLSGSDVYHEPSKSSSD